MLLILSTRDLGSYLQTAIEMFTGISEWRKLSLQANRLKANHAEASV